MLSYKTAAHVTFLYMHAFELLIWIYVIQLIILLLHKIIK